MLQLSLRTVFAAIAAVAVLLAIAVPWPHVAIFLATIIATAATTRTWLLFKRLRLLLLPCVACWFSLYVASAGPVAAAIHYVSNGNPKTSTTVIVVTVYLPALVTMPQPQLRWYIQQWGHMFSDRPRRQSTQRRPQTLPRHHAALSLVAAGQQQPVLYWGYHRARP